ncbi:hypothetical protein OJ997_01890 [Solirubrobacter phytolaccae]|uniref:Uncharacterized protein n=1 Tax=Solirubrobacter phytolaccae TaxID=1404360 RepID=A0A9X3S996_9ACTN|nr:hypothetical protein [Solirubrobacter phytolaccae]MDA0179030.1 hypothetical protein [Solirubrobacter phytolaccae]
MSLMTDLAMHVAARSAERVDVWQLDEIAAEADADLARLPLARWVVDAVLALEPRQRETIAGARYMLAMESPEDLPAMDLLLVAATTGGTLDVLAAELAAQTRRHLVTAVALTLDPDELSGP